MITLEMFQALCTIDQVTPLFLNFSFGFSKKTKSSDEHYMACYYHISPDEKANNEESTSSGAKIDQPNSHEKPSDEFFGQCPIDPLSFFQGPKDTASQIYATTSAILNFTSGTLKILGHAANLPYIRSTILSMAARIGLFYSLQSFFQLLLEILNPINRHIQ